MDLTSAEFELHVPQRPHSAERLAHPAQLEERRIPQSRLGSAHPRSHMLKRFIPCGGLYSDRPLAVKARFATGASADRCSATVGRGRMQI
jgi:hypothetical protein